MDDLRKLGWGGEGISDWELDGDGIDSIKGTKCGDEIDCEKHIEGSKLLIESLKSV